jgi:quinol monooxygenase YgiN
MITITAIIRAKTGRLEDLKAALLAVAEYVDRNEPDTIGFFISQDIDDPSVFTTYERFSSSEAKDTHNGSSAVSAFFVQADALIEQPVFLHTCAEISARRKI